MYSLVPSHLAHILWLEKTGKSWINYPVGVINELRNISHEIEGLDLLYSGDIPNGAGFGGCTVSLVEEDSVEEFIREVGKNYEARTGLNPDFYIAEVGSGARRV